MHQTLSSLRSIRSVALGCLFLSVGLFLTGCGKEEAAPAEAPARPVKLKTLSASDAGAPLEFPAVVRARNSVELAFNVPGQVTELTAIEGEPVTEGSLLASLDNTEYRARLDAAQAALELAETEFKRFSELSESGAVAIAELDQKRADHNATDKKPQSQTRSPVGNHHQQQG